MDKNIDLIRVIDRMIVMKVLVQKSIISVISIYFLHCGFSDSQKDDFYVKFTTVNGIMGKKEIVIIAQISIVTSEVLEKTLGTSMEMII